MAQLFDGAKPAFDTDLLSVEMRNNFLALLSSSSGTVSPAYAITGTLFYDTSLSDLFVFNGVTFDEVLTSVPTLEAVRSAGSILAGDIDFAGFSALSIKLSGSVLVNDINFASNSALSFKTTSPTILTDIKDSSGNEILVLSETAVAVNELKIANAATATNPGIEVQGGDTNIGLDLTAKGTGFINSKSKFRADKSVLGKVETVVISAGAASVDATLASDYRIDANANFTLDITSSTDGQKLVIWIKQDVTGSRLLTLGTSFAALGTDVTDITLSTAANSIDVLGCIFRSDLAKWTVIGIARGF